MTFEEWWPSYYEFGDKWHSDCAKAAWDYQQARIEALEKEQSAWRKFTDEANRTLEAADKKIATLQARIEALEAAATDVVECGVDAMAYDRRQVLDALAALLQETDHETK